MAKLAIGAGVGSNRRAPRHKKMDRKPPEVVIVPTLQGSALIGMSVAVRVGQWAGVPRPSFSLQWRRDDSDIPGATAVQYAPVPADDGALIRCVVTAANPLGTVSAVSDAARVRYPAPVYQGGLTDRRFQKDLAISPIDLKSFFSGENLVFKAEDLPEGLSIDEGVISGTPRTLKVSAVVISASNSGGDDRGMFNVVVYEEPAEPDIDQPAPVYGGGLLETSWTLGAPILPFDVSAFFTGDDLSFTATGLPEGVGVDATTGVIAGTPVSALTTTVTVTVTNSGGTAQASFDVEVAPANEAPVVADPGAIGGPAWIGEAVSVAGESVSGSPAPVLSYQWTRDGVDILGADALEYTPSDADDGAQIARRITAQSGAVSDSAVSPAVSVAYRAPTAASALPDRDYVMGSGAKTIDAATDFTALGDPALDGVVWSVTGAGASISPAGIVTLPTDTQRNAATVTVTATNSGGTVSSAFSVTVAAATGLTVNIARVNYASDNAYKAAFISTFDDAVTGSGAFSAARSGDVRRINLDGIVGTAFETGTSSRKNGLQGRVEVIGSGLDTCKWHGAGHVIHGGTTARNVDLLIDGMELSLGNVGSRRPSSVTGQCIDFQGRWRTVELGRDAGFNRYSFAVGGATNYDYADIRQYFRYWTLSGVTTAEYNAITPMSTIVSFSGLNTRVEAKENLGGGRVKIWVNSSDAGENNPKWINAANGLSSGTTVSWAGGSGRCESNTFGDGVPPAFSQTSRGADYRDFIYRGLIFNAGEVRVTADNLCEFSGVWDWVGNGDYWKQRANQQGKYPAICRLRRAVARNSVPGRPVSGAHSDIIQWFDNSVSGTQNVLLEIEDVLFFLGRGMTLGQRPKAFGDWGTPAQVQLLPGSKISNSFFDVGAVQSSLELLDGPLAIDRLCMVNSGITGHDGASVGDGTMRGYPNQTIADSIVGKIHFRDRFDSERNVAEIGNAAADDYTAYFPDYDRISGTSVEALLAKFAPASAYADQSPITGDGAFRAANGDILWTTSGAPDGSTGGGSGGEDPVDPDEPDDNTPDPGVEIDGTLTPQAHDGDFVGHRAGVTDTLAPGALLGVQVDRLRARASGVHQLIFSGSAQPEGYTSVTLRIGEKTITLPWVSGQYRVTGQGSDFYDYLMANVDKSLDVSITGS